MRILDFTGTSGVGNAPAVIDAKFSYIGNDDNGTNRFDNWGPGQAADQLTIYQSLAAGVAAPAHGVPIATDHACGCNAQLLKDMLFAKMAKKLLESQGKRNAGKRAERARDDYGRMTKASRFISSADVKYVK